MIKQLTLFLLLLTQGTAQTGRTGSTISGRVFSNGKPAAGMRVAALDGASSPGESLLVRVTQTDDEGRYRLDDLSPGSYYVIAGPLAQPSYFPGVLDRGVARQLQIRAGASLDSVDFPILEALVCAGDVPQLPDAVPALAIAADGAGNVFFAEIGKGTVRKISPDGRVSTVAGGASVGISNDDRPANSLAAVSVLATDLQGNLFIAEKSAPRILKVTPEGTITTVAGNGSRGGVSGDGGPALAASLCIPIGLAVDGLGNLFIASGHSISDDSGRGRIEDDFRVRKVDIAGNITTLAGNGRDHIYASGELPPEGVPATAGSATPRAITADRQGNLYYYDGRYIRKVTPEGIVATVADAGGMRIGANGGLAVDTSGNLFLVGYGGVRKIAPDGAVTAVVRDGTVAIDDLRDLNGSRLTMEVFPGRFMAAGGAGNLFIAENRPLANRILKIAPDGGMTTIFSTVSGAAVSGQLISTVPRSAYSERGFAGVETPMEPRGTLYLVSRDTGETRTVQMQPSIDPPDNGRFQIPFVERGFYDLFASLPDIDGWGEPSRALSSRAYGRTTLAIAGEATSVTVTVHPGVDLKGRLTVDGRPAASPGLQIHLQPDAQALTFKSYKTVSQFHPVIGSDGTFTFPALPEAVYGVVVEAPPESNLTVLDIRLNGISVVDSGIALGAALPGMLEIAMTVRLGQ